MPATDYSSTTSFGRSILSLRREQVHSMDSLDSNLESFQRHVTDKFSDLPSEDLLSLPWIRKILESFLSCQEEFRKILNNCGDICSRAPLDRMIGDYFERSVKGLDVCNAIRDGIEQVREWKKLIEIVLCALGDDNREKFLGEGHFRRAKKALIDLSISMLDEKESTAALAHRNRSFGRQKEQAHHHRSLGHFRSLSWSVSRSWSAARQLQAIANNLVPPKTNDVATNGMAIAVFTMSTILLFVMWVLVAAIPCQDRGLQVHFAVPRHFPWAAPIMTVHERVLEESRKRERRNASGLLKEIYMMDKSARVIADLADSLQFPLSEEKEKEARLRVTELRIVCDGFKEGLDPLERQVRQVFHRIVHSRTEGLDSLGRANHHE